jgi:hypothetical protein
MPESTAPPIVLAIDPVSDGSLVLSCNAFGEALDQQVSVLLASSRLDEQALENLLRARSEVETWLSRSGRRRAMLEPLWFLMWEHETFELLNRMRALSALPLSDDAASASFSGEKTGGQIASSLGSSSVIDDVGFADILDQDSGS